jgi:hypothetical protein
MRRRSRHAGIAGGFALAAALLTAAPLVAQGLPPQELSPDDELSPSQVVQPMPAQVTEPSGAPAAAATARSAPAASRPTAQPQVAKEAASPARHRGGSVRTAVECSGPFAKDSGMLALAVAYDARNMIFTDETVQGTHVGVTVLFSKDPRRRLEVWWQNANRTGVYLIDIAGKSIWTAPKGLRLGLTLEQLQKLNRKPFKLKGFNEDGVASVADWDGGQLAALPGDCKAGVSLRATGEKATDVAKDLPAKDQYSSDDPALRSLRLTVSEILIGY